MSKKIASLLAFSVGMLITPCGFCQLPKDLKVQDEKYREYMVNISRQLGVTCNNCHDTNNFSSNEKINFKKSKEHIRITQTLIDAGFDGLNNNPKADCFMCHRGKLHPDYKEAFDPVTMKKKEK